MKKHTTLELTVSPDYVRDWGVWEAIRELLQNAYDVDETGFAASISRKPNGVLKIKNEGITLSRETMLLGVTSKTGSSQRGQFGEGYKLAWLVLLRNGYKVICRTADECWEPFIGHSTTFGRDTLQVKIRPATYKNRVSVEVEPINEEDWNMIRERCLLLNKPGKDESIEIDSESLLLGEKFAGLLYSRGLYVGKIPSEYHFGYDLADVKLDRDRRLADPWSFRYNVQRLLKKALDSGFVLPEQIYRLLLQDSGEAEALAEYYRYGGKDGLTQKIAALFKEQHGDNAIPVNSMSESAEAGHFGLRGVVLPKRLVSLVEKEVGTLSERKASSATDVLVVHSWDDFNETEKENFLWLVSLGKRIPEFNPEDLTVVDFVGSVLGTYSDGDIKLSRKIMTNREQLVITLVHEVAHYAGPDGSVEHRDAMDRIYAKLVVEAMKGIN